MNFISLPGLSLILVTNLAHIGAVAQQLGSDTSLHL